MSYAPTVLVFEFFTGGGCPAGALPGRFAREALGMLWAVLEDFHRWGSVRSLTALDPRFESLVPGLDRHTLPADQCVPASPGEYEEIFLSLLGKCDAVLIIAPETDGILEALTNSAETAGITVLGSSASAVSTAGNKAACSRLFDLARLASPMTRTASFASAPHVASLMGCPLVVKPLDGVGCEGVCLLERLSDLPSVLDRVRQSTTQEQILLQSLANGIPASVSLLIARGQCLPLSLNLQRVEPGLPFRYLGSRVPLCHPRGEQAVTLASSAAGLIPGLSGYVGVDLVVSDDLVQLIEINPRLTTSYIGLRQVAPINLAQAIWNAGVHGQLPDRAPMKGQAEFRKDDPDTWGLVR